MNNYLTYLAQLLYALGVILVAFVTWAVTRRVKCDAAYREGHRDGWNQFADKLQEQRREREWRMRPKPGTTISVMLPDGDSYEKRAPLEPPLEPPRQ